MSKWGSVNEVTHLFDGGSIAMIAAFLFVYLQKRIAFSKLVTGWLTFFTVFLICISFLLETFSESELTHENYQIVVFISFAGKQTKKRLSRRCFQLRKGPGPNFHSPRLMDMESRGIDFPPILSPINSMILASFKRFLSESCTPWSEFRRLPRVYNCLRRRLGINIACS